jgi:glycosyltransferase involved in cell wall biosynthesis
LNNLLVSIIIPCYNAEKYLAETIRSILDQSYQHLEIILVDDGSSDGSIAIATSFNDHRIIILKQQNCGASAARNHGLASCKGDFVQYLDADDLLSPNKIQVQLEKLAKHPDQVAVCSTIHFTGDDYLNNSPSPYEEAFLYSTTDTSGFLINLWGGNSENGSMIQTNAWLIPMSVIKKAGPWRDFYSPDDDGEYFSRVILASSGIIYTPECYNYYRKVENGLSNRNHYKASYGCYQAILFKQENLFKYRNDEKAKLVIAKQLMAIAMGAYPQYLSLTKEIMSKVKALGNYKYGPVSGGPTIQKVSKLFGWKIARLFYYIFRSK